LLEDNRSTIHEFFWGLDTEFPEYNPTELVYDRAMKWAIEHGYDEYNLGINRPDFNAGLSVFKDEL
jgi:lipid II:glycine glycyltransferase (peptidoglycan interpeptide bridge formation enzyme)